MSEQPELMGYDELDYWRAAETRGAPNARVIAVLIAEIDRLRARLVEAEAVIEAARLHMETTWGVGGATGGQRTGNALLIALAGPDSPESSEVSERPPDGVATGTQGRTGQIGADASLDAGQTGAET